MKKAMLIFTLELSILFGFHMLDFGLTYYGINVAKIIAEGNHVWVDIFAVPLPWAIILRVLYYVVLMLIPLIIIHKYRPKTYKWVIYGSYFVNICILIMHSTWIRIYLTM